ncbi:hypothetical protein QN400_24880, partial [Pseudomonas sp. RTC3]|nr:hypothetical protein [Pseudomonas sp. RTC3]
TVAPALSLSVKVYLFLRIASLAVVREMGVESGGSKVLFGFCEFRFEGCPSRLWRALRLSQGTESCGQRGGVDVCIRVLRVEPG